MPFMSGAEVCGSWGRSKRGFLGLVGRGRCLGKMIACDVSQVVILGQGTAVLFQSARGGSDWGKALGLIRLVWGSAEL